MAQNDDKIRKLAQENEEEDEGGGTQGRGGNQYGGGSQYEDRVDFGQIEQGDDEGDSGQGTAGGAAGEIEFHYKDPYFTTPRDAQLPPEEIKRLLIVHRDQHKGNVDKQKQTRKERAAMKEGKRLNNQTGTGYGAGLDNHYKTHPIAMKAQFSGIDKQVSNLPNNNEANTNDELREKLDNRLENTYKNENRPTFNPKPRPY